MVGEDGRERSGELAEKEASRKPAIGSALEQVIRQAGQELGGALEEMGKAVEEAGKAMGEAGKRGLGN